MALRIDFDLGRGIVLGLCLTLVEGCGRAPVEAVDYTTGEQDASTGEGGGATSSLPQGEEGESGAEGGEFPGCELDFLDIYALAEDAAVSTVHLEGLEVLAGSQGAGGALTSLQLVDGEAFSFITESIMDAALASIERDGDLVFAAANDLGDGSGRLMSFHPLELQPNASRDDFAGSLRSLRAGDERIFAHLASGTQNPSHWVFGLDFDTLEYEYELAPPGVPVGIEAYEGRVILVENSQDVPGAFDGIELRNEKLELLSQVPPPEGITTGPVAAVRDADLLYVSFGQQLVTYDLTNLPELPEVARFEVPAGASFSHLAAGDFVLAALSGPTHEVFALVPDGLETDLISRVSLSELGLEATPSSLDVSDDRILVGAGRELVLLDSRSCLP